MTVGNVFIYYCEFENMRFSPSFHEVEVLDIKALWTGGWNPKAKKKKKALKHQVVTQWKNILNHLARAIAFFCWSTWARLENKTRWLSTAKEKMIFNDIQYTEPNIRGHCHPWRVKHSVRHPSPHPSWNMPCLFVPRKMFRQGTVYHTKCACGVGEVYLWLLYIFTDYSN